MLATDRAGRRRMRTPLWAGSLTPASGRSTTGENLAPGSDTPPDLNCNFLHSCSGCCGFLRRIGRVSAQETTGARDERSHGRVEVDDPRQHDRPLGPATPSGQPGPPMTTSRGQSTTSRSRQNGSSSGRAREAQRKSAPWPCLAQRRNEGVGRDPRAEEEPRHAIDVRARPRARGGGGGAARRPRSRARSAPRPPEAGGRARPPAARTGAARSSGAPPAPRCAPPPTGPRPVAAPGRRPRPMPGRRLAGACLAVERLAAREGLAVERGSRSARRGHMRRRRSPRRRRPRHRARRRPGARRRRHRAVRRWSGRPCRARRRPRSARGGPGRSGAT